MMSGVLWDLIQGQAQGQAHTSPNENCIWLFEGVLDRMSDHGVLAKKQKLYRLDNPVELNPLRKVPHTYVSTRFDPVGGDVRSSFVLLSVWRPVVALLG